MSTLEIRVARLERTNRRLAFAAASAGAVAVVMLLGAFGQRPPKHIIEANAFRIVGDDGAPRGAFHVVDGVPSLSLDAKDGKSWIRAAILENGEPSFRLQYGTNDLSIFPSKAGGFAIALGDEAQIRTAIQRDAIMFWEADGSGFRTALTRLVPPDPPVIPAKP